MPMTDAAPIVVTGFVSRSHDPLVMLLSSDGRFDELARELQSMAELKLSEMPTDTIEVSRAEWDRLNAALARESAKVHQQQRELMELRTELERMRNAD